MQRTQLRIHVRPDGERLPILSYCHTGVPVFEPTVYVLTQRRGCAANTVHQDLVAIRALLLFCDHEGWISVSGSLPESFSLPINWTGSLRL
jgi:hypothetical protein